MKPANKQILINEITLDEGLRLKPYRCTSGKLTIGVGRNLDDRGIFKDESRLMLSNDLKASISEAEGFVWYEGLNPVRKRIIVNMIFNMGLSRFKKFKKTIKYIKNGQYDHASIEMLDSVWARQVGKRAKRLSNQMREG
jgi:lysozyme